MQGQNLFTWTKWRGLDPENNNVYGLEPKTYVQGGAGVCEGAVLHGAVLHAHTGAGWCRCYCAAGWITIVCVCVSLSLTDGMM